MVITLFLSLSIFAAEPISNDLKNLMEATRKADAEMPPCAGLKHQAEVFFRVSPPKTCPYSRRFWEAMRKVDAVFQYDCDSMSKLVSGARPEPEVVNPRMTQEKLAEVKREGMEKLEEFTKDVEDPGAEEGDKACEPYIQVGYHFRKYQLSLVNKHYGKADSALDSVNHAEDLRDVEEGAKEYLDYLERGGD
jgi:hypothetical protein